MNICNNSGMTTDVREIKYGRYAIGAYSKHVLLAFLQPVTLRNGLSKT